MNDNLYFVISLPLCYASVCLFPMDSTLFTIFAVLLAAMVWFMFFVIKMNRAAAGKVKTRSVKEELFGKKKPKKSKESWSIE